MLDPGLAGARALVGGGSSGIGAAIAMGLARHGAAVAVGGRSGAASTVAEIRRGGGIAYGIAVDVSEGEAAAGMVRDAAGALGGLDLYVNVAAGAWHEDVVDLTAEAWDRTMATNVRACALACREAGRILARQGKGAILVVGSTSVATPARSEAAYRASKAALRAFTQTLAVEMAPHGVRANMLTPGAFDTRLFADVPADIRRIVEARTPLGRIGRPSELVPMALLLLSDSLSPFTTGADVVVDGGLSLGAISVARTETRLDE